MEYRTVSWYQEFHCIGGICEDSCCENWEIDLDAASLKNYMKQGGAFGKRLKDNTRVKEKQFILNGTRCPFLNDDNLCDIYIEMGEDCLCETCTNFPRHIEEFGNLKEVSLTMSCPQASRIMLAKKEKMTFVCKEGKDQDYGLKAVKPVKTLAFWKRPQVNHLDEKLYHSLFKMRDFLFLVLQDREIPISRRIATTLLFGQEIQTCIDENTYEKMDDILEEYRDYKEQTFYNETLIRYENQPAQKEPWMKQVLHMYEGLETIKEEWTDILLAGIETMHHTKLDSYEQLYKEFQVYYKEKEYEFEHIVVYYIFNYFLGASYDKDAFTKLKFAVVSYLVILELDIARWIQQHKIFLYEDQVLVAHAYSKEVEHSYNNFESLQLVMSAHPILDLEHILIALLS